MASDDVENTSLRSTLSTYCERIQRFFRYNSSGSGTTQPIRTEGAEQPRQREGESSEPEEVDNDAGDDPNIWKVRVNDLAYSDSRNYAVSIPYSIYLLYTHAMHYTHMQYNIHTCNALYTHAIRYTHMRYVIHLHMHYTPLYTLQ